MQLADDYLFAYDFNFFMHFVQIKITFHKVVLHAKENVFLYLQQKMYFPPTVIASFSAVSAYNQKINSAYKLILSVYPNVYGV